MEASMGDAIIRMFLALVLGAQAPTGDAAKRRSLRDCIEGDAAAYVELNVAALRQSVEAIPELRTALLLGGGRAKAFDEAVTRFAQLSGLNAEAVKTVFSDVHGVGVWVFGAGEDLRYVGLLAVVDRGAGSAAILEKLVKRAEEPVAPPAAPGVGPGARRPPRARQIKEWVKVTYAGTQMYGFGRRRRSKIWLSETNGRIGIATDLMTMQRFILRAKLLEKAKPVAARGGVALLHAELDVPKAMNAILSMADGHDMEEVLIVPTLLDMAAWGKVRLVMNLERLGIVADLAPSSPLLKAVRGVTKSPEVLNVLPDGTGLAVILAPGSAKAVWEYAEPAIGMLGAVFGGQADFAAQMKQGCRSELGLDIEKDIVGNLTAAGLVVPSVEHLRDDFEDGFALVGGVRDATKAKAALRILVATVGRHGDRQAPVVQDEMTIWNIGDEAQFAIAGKKLVVGPTQSRDKTAPTQMVISQIKKGPSRLSGLLAKRYPRATVYGVLNPGVFFPRMAVDPVTAGLTVKGDSLMLRADFDTRGVARSILAMAATTACSANLRQIARACDRHLNDFGKYPSKMSGLLKYLDGNKKSLVCPLSGKPYVYNSRLAGKQIGTVDDRGKTVLAHDVAGSHPDGGCVVYLDGRAILLKAEGFAKAIGRK